MAPQRSFTSRHRKLIWSTFFIVFVLNFLLVLFQAPVYQSMASVMVLPPSADPVATAAGIQGADVIKEAQAKLASGSNDEHAYLAGARAVAAGAAMPGRFALIVESDNPEYSAALANAWAETVTADSSGRSKVIMQAEAASYPIRPKKAQSILLGGLFGYLLGLAFAFLRERKQKLAPEPRAANPVPDR